MKTFWLQIVGLLIVIFAALMITVNRNSIPTIFNPFGGQSVLTQNKLNIKNADGVIKASISVELAETKDKRVKGLGGRDNLASDSGMLFVFDKSGQYKFWMKGMKIPLDFIWIEGDKVVDLLPNVPPPQPGQADDSLPLFASSVEVDKILEVNSNFIREHNIISGDKIELLR